MAVSTELIATCSWLGSWSPLAASAASTRYFWPVATAASCIVLSTVVTIFRPPPWISASVKPLSASSSSTCLIRKPFVPP